MKTVFIAAALLCGAFSGPALSQNAGGVQTIQDCVDRKSPEGIPASGPLREKILREMQGGPQACIGVIRSACERARRPFDECTRMESSAWLHALQLDADSRKQYGAKNIAVYDAGVKRIEANAIALCRSAAAVSAWGGDMIKSGKMTVKFDRSHRCVMDMIAQQALAVLVNRRGA